MELLGGIKAEGLLHMGDIIVPQGRAMDEPSVGTLATKSNGCANVDKGRLAFDRLRLFKGSDDDSKLIHYRDQETKGGRKNKRTDIVRPIVDLNDMETNSGHLGGGIVGEINFNASIHSNLDNKHVRINQLQDSIQGTN
jgi:hypothetical protein